MNSNTTPRMYKFDEPLYTASQVDPATWNRKPLELGQAKVLHEAMFFLSIGYCVQEAHWEKDRFLPYRNFYPGLR